MVKQQRVRNGNWAGQNGGSWAVKKKDLLYLLSLHLRFILPLLKWMTLPSFKMNILLKTHLIGLWVSHNPVAMSNTLSKHLLDSLESRDRPGIIVWPQFSLDYEVMLTITTFEAGPSSPAWTVLWIPRFLALANMDFSSGVYISATKTIINGRLYRNLWID